MKKCFRLSNWMLHWCVLFIFVTLPCLSFGSSDNTDFESGLFYYDYQMYGEAIPFFQDAYAHVPTLAKREELLDYYYESQLLYAKETGYQIFISKPSEQSLVTASNYDLIMQDLQQLGDEQRYKLAVQLFYDPEPTILESMLGNDFAIIQALAIHLIRTHHYETLVEQIISLLESDNFVVRNQAAMTLSYFQYTPHQLAELGYIEPTMDRMQLQRRDASLYLKMMKYGDPFLVRILDVTTLKYLITYLKRHIKVYNNEHPWQVATMFSDRYLSTEGVQAFASGLLNFSPDVIRIVCGTLVDYFQSPQTDPKNFSKQMIASFVHEALNQVDQADDATQAALGMFKTDLLLWVDEEYETLPESVLSELSFEGEALNG